MMNHARRILALMAFVLLLALATGCSATSKYMHEAASAPALRPPGDQALVVFVRPSGFARGIRTTILDGRGRFLGDSLPSSYFSAAMAPGKHVFIAWAENTAVLQADLAPGKTYFVEVAPKMGFMSARMQLLALTPRSENWKELKEWLASSKPLDRDEAGGQAYLEERRDDTADRLKSAKEVAGAYTPEELAERTLRPEDGN